MSAGFKCSGALLEHLSGLDSAVVTGTAVRVLATVRLLAGDHVQHITDLMAAKSGRVTAYEPGCVLGEDPVTFVGLKEQPEGLPGRIGGVHAEPAARAGSRVRPGCAARPSEAFFSPGL